MKRGTHFITYLFLVQLLLIWEGVEDVCGLPLQNNGMTLSTSEVLAYMVQYGYLQDRSTGTVLPTAGTSQPSNIINTGQPISIPGSSKQLGNQVTTGQIVDPKKKLKDAAKSASGSKHVFRTQSQNTQYSDREIETALYDFQRYMDIPLSGKLDDSTSAVIRQPRCGMKDKLPHLPWTPLRRDRRRRFVLHGSKWPGRSVTYTIAKATSKLSFQQQNNTIFKAINIWSGVIPITFHWTDNVKNADIVIRFEKGAHGDKQVFDGKGNILGHAFYQSDPAFAGHVHFDEEEDWSVGSVMGTSTGKKNLLLVAMHELGHVLGLQHSSVKSALMYPLYMPRSLPTSQKYTRRAVLDPDDIAGVQSLYGRCGPQLDSIFSWMGDGRTYTFKGKYFWRFDDVAKETYPGFPKLISSHWKDIPDGIDEVFLWGYNWKTYFFKGRYYYRYHDSLGRADDYYPKLISDGWPGIPDNIDAAFTWSNHVSYFFKDHLCYRFDNTYNRVYQGYPKNISEVWPGVPNKIDTVFRYYWDGSTYFFSGTEYWKLYDKTAVLKGPLKIANGWKNICLV